MSATCSSCSLTHWKPLFFSSACCSTYSIFTRTCTHSCSTTEGKKSCSLCSHEALQSLGWIEPTWQKGVWLFICGRDLVPGDKMSPRQQWRASERLDNRASDPCSMLDSTTRLLPPFFLSGGLSPESSMALRAYLTVPAWQHSYTPMSVPKVQRPLYS